MSQKTANAAPAKPEAAEESDIKRQLLRRVGFAGLLIALLLAALALVDQGGKPAPAPSAAAPIFNEPVPVGKREVAQPLSSGDAAPAADASDAAAAGDGRAAGDAPPGAEPSPAAAAAASTAAGTPAATRAAAAPEPPQIPARPSLPPAPLRALAAPASPAAAPPARPAAGQKAAAPATSASPAAPVAPAAAPARLFTGYAVQAGVFADARHAEELRAILTLNGIPSSLEARVQVGPFKTRAEAIAAREKLKNLGIDGILLPPNKSSR